jgi:hypothetical protein
MRPPVGPIAPDFTSETDLKCTARGLGLDDLRGHTATG